MAFAQTWNEGDLGSEQQDQIDDLIESTRIGVRERAAVEHNTYADETGQTDVWRHKKTAGRCNYGLAANKPSTIATGMTDGALYYETDTSLLVKYNTTSAAWVTVGGPTHSGSVTTYTTGTVAVTLDNAVVTGTNTVWSTNLTTASVFLGPDGEYYAITSIDSDVQITLARTYDGTTASGQSYTAYLDGHPQYVAKGGGTINGALTIDEALTVNGEITGAHSDGDIDTAELADNAITQSGFAYGSTAQAIASATYVDLDSMEVTITTSGQTGSAVMIDYAISADANGSGTHAHLWGIIDIDGATEANSEMKKDATTDDQSMLVGCFLKTGLSAASHTFKLQVKQSSGTPRIYQRMLRVVELKK